MMKTKNEIRYVFKRCPHCKKDINIGDYPNNDNTKFNCHYCRGKLLFINDRVNPLIVKRYGK